jgi:gamma-glutamyltranspeptidase/glutathione hydrolase
MVMAGALVLASGAVAVRGQDPDEGAGRGRPLAAYRPSVPGIHGLVTAGHPLAAMAGLQVLMKGGNAIDAAVAIGAALNMMEPQMNGIGGNGFMTVFDKKTGKVHSLAMAGAAPKGIKAADMTPKSLNSGINAGIVPGNFGGYLAVLERFGTMSLADVLAPAIDYAEHGYPIDPSLATAIDRAKANLSQYPTTAKVFLPGGRAPLAGELFKNPDLAETLKKATVVVDFDQIAAHLVVGISEVALFSWLMFFSHIAPIRRVKFLALAVATIVIASLMTFADGFTGDGRPILRWRFARAKSCFGL